MEKRVRKFHDDELIEYKFDSIWSLFQHLKQSKITKPFQKDRSSESGSFEFTGTKNYTEAERLCLYGGDKSEFEKFMYLKESLDDTLIEKQVRTIQYNDFVGDTPNVPMYLMGHPLNMIRQKKEEFSEDKIIDIYFNISVSSSVEKSQIFNRGIIALTLIDHLESLGYKVNLHLFELSTSDDQICLYEFNLKEIDQPTDYRTLFFPLTHPSFLRRIIFRLVETTPELNSSWADGYGKPANWLLIRDVFDIEQGNKFVFYSPDDMGIYGADLEEDFKRCMSRLGVEEKLDLSKKTGNKR